ncbi:MAG: TadE family protein [Candidatus Nanopelagicales bacterium]
MTTGAVDAARARRRGRGQAGAATVELTIIFPVILLLIFGIVQATVWYHGRTLAMLAAQDGLRVAQALDGTSAEGREQAVEALAGNGATGFLTDANVTTTRTATSVNVTITARSVALLPGTGLPITQRATGPVERLPETP